MQALRIAGDIKIELENENKLDTRMYSQWKEKDTFSNGNLRDGIET